MPTLPTAMIAVGGAVAPRFAKRIWGHAQVLLAGAILAPAPRTVTAARRVTGLEHSAQFHRDHRVLRRAPRSSLAVSRGGRRLLVASCAPTDPLVCGVDVTLERRRGKTIAPTGIDRDAVRSSQAHVAPASG